MSLKRIGQKITAVFIMALMLYGDLALCGVGIGKAIAENLKAPELEIALTNSAYVQYSSKSEEDAYELADSEKKEVNQTEQEDYAGVAIQSNLKLISSKLDEGISPVGVQIEVNLPSINKEYPEKVILAKASTLLTSGETENKTLDQNYDQNSGLFVISYENLNDDLNSINTEDEFEIIYIYPEESYTGNNEDVELSYSVNVNSTYKTENDLITSNNKKTETFTYSENVGDLAALKLTGINENIYKGYMYSNVENGTNYNTKFETTSTLSILNHAVLDELFLSFEENKFELNDENSTQILASDVVYNSAKIKKAEFDKIFGKDGVLEFYDSERLFATIKYLEIENDKQLVAIYSDGKLDFLDEELNITVNFPDLLKSYVLKTTKPLTAGLLTISNGNEIKAADDYGARVSKIKYIEVNTLANEYKVTRKIELLEPKTDINFTSSINDFNVLETNKTTLTITLSNTKPSCKLYKNPVIQIIFPNEIKSANVSSPEILNANGLSIKNATAEANAITIELEGEQTEYDLNSITGGTTIVMDIENLVFPVTLPRKNSKITVKCMQDGQEVSKECDINIKTLDGVSLINDFYDSNNNIRVLNNEEKTIDILGESERKGLSELITVVNNSESTMENITIVGRLNQNATFNTLLNGKVTLNSENARIYYSDNKNAISNDESWSEEYIQNAQAFKVVLEKIEIAENLQIGAGTILPSNIGNNQKSQIITELIYTQNGEIKNTFSTLSMQTEIKEFEEKENVVTETVTNENGIELPVKLTVTPVLKQDYVHAGQVVTYKIKVANLSNETLENLTLKDIIPENAAYRYIKEFENETGTAREEAFDFELKEKTWEIEKLEANKTVEFEIKLKVSEDIKEEKLLNKAILFSNNSETIESISDLTLKPSNILVRLQTDTDVLEDSRYPSASIVTYYINVKNISNRLQKNIDIKYDLPKEVTYVASGSMNFTEEDGYSWVDYGTEENNQLSYTINKINPGESFNITVKAKINRLGLGGDYKISSIANVITNNGEIYETDYNTIITNQTTYKLSYYSNRNNNELLKPGDEITYTLELTNTSEANSNVKLEDILPEALKAKDVIYYTNSNNVKEIAYNNNNVILDEAIGANQTLRVNITATVLEQYAEVETDAEIANSIKLSFGDFEYTTDSIKVLTKTTVKEGFTEEDYSISGKAWVDINQNGMQDEEDSILENVKVTLVDKLAGKYVYDNNGNILTTTTDKDGNYSFKNLKKRTYIVLFQYDSQMFNVATYKKDEVEENNNSDAIQTKVMLDGITSIAGITDGIYLNSDYENIDIGLIVNGEYETLYKEFRESQTTNTILESNTNNIGYIVVTIFSITIIIASAVIIKKKIIDEKF